MPNITSSLGTSQSYIPAVNSTQIGKFAGLHMHFPTLASLNAAVTAERANISASSAIWSDGQRMSVASETPHVYRVWSTGAQHARNVVIRPGLIVTVTADSNTVLATSGAPSSGTGADGDLAIDFLGNGYFMKSSGAWAAGATSLYSGTASLITYSGTGRSLTATDNGNIIRCTANTAVSMTVPSALGTSFSCSIIQGGTGVVTVVAGSGVTLVANTALSTNGLESAVGVTPAGTNTYTVYSPVVAGAGTLAALTDIASYNLAANNAGLATALAAKQSTLVSATNVKTINGTSILGAGDLTISTAGTALGAFSSAGTSIGNVQTFTPAAGVLGTITWERDGAAIAGATSLTYTLVSADAGHVIRPNFVLTGFKPTGITAAGAAPVFTAQSAPAGAVNSAYTYTFVATGAVSYAIASGTLPAGLSLNTSTGVLSGTPTAAATSTFVISATNPSGTTSSTSQSVIVTGTTGTITFATPILPSYTEYLDDYSAWALYHEGVSGVRFKNGTAGLIDTLTLTNATDTGKYFPNKGGLLNFSNAEGALYQDSGTSELRGFSITTGGTPAKARIKAKSTSATGNKLRCWIGINGSGGGAALTVKVTASFEDGSITPQVSYVQGSLGFESNVIALDITYSSSTTSKIVVDFEVGSGTGTATTFGIQGFGFVDASVLPVYVWENAQPGTVGVPYAFTYNALGATSYAVSSGSLPAGLSFNTSTGVLSGTPTSAGSSTFVISATNGGGTVSSTSQVVPITAAATGGSMVLTTLATGTGENNIPLHNMSSEAYIDWVVFCSRKSNERDVYKATGGKLIGRPVEIDGAKRLYGANLSHNWDTGSGLRYDNDEVVPGGSPAYGSPSWAPLTQVNPNSKVRFYLPASTTSRTVVLQVILLGEPNNVGNFIRFSLSDASATEVLKSASSISTHEYDFQWFDLQLVYSAASAGKSLIISLEKPTAGFANVGVSFIGYK